MFANNLGGSKTTPGNQSCLQNQWLVIGFSVFPFSGEPGSKSSVLSWKAGRQGSGTKQASGSKNVDSHRPVKPITERWLSFVLHPHKWFEALPHLSTPGNRTPLAPTRADFSEISASQKSQQLSSVSSLQTPHMDATRRPR